MQGLPRFTDPNLLIGVEDFSDAGVYRLADGLAIVQTVDFFPPIVDDPFAFGQIAAANSLSDVYAIGATPKTALNIVCFPDHELDLEVLHEILRGGADRVAAAGAVVVGGHSLRDDEIKFGLAVTGVVDPDAMLGNAGARVGDALVLTKALGTGFITTAARAGRCPEETLAATIDSMIRLNDVACDVALDAGAHAETDITGFALAGHGFELAEASGVTVAFELGRLPTLPDAITLAVKENYTRANATNQAYIGHGTRWETAEDHPRAMFMFDPQTSGGLLLSVPADCADDVVARVNTHARGSAAIVGRVEERGDAALVIRA